VKKELLQLVNGSDQPQEESPRSRPTPVRNLLAQLVASNLIVDSKELRQKISNHYGLDQSKGK